MILPFDLNKQKYLEPLYDHVFIDKSLLNNFYSIYLSLFEQGFKYSAALNMLNKISRNTIS